MNTLLAISTAIGMTIAPFLLVENLGISLIMLGIIEGIFEMSSSLIKLLSGIVFDKIKRVRYLFFIPAILACISKSFLFHPIALNIVISKGLERIANGMFATPRDAFILENTKNKGLSYGLLNASKTLGCVIGSVLVGLLVYTSGISLEFNLNFIILISGSVAWFASLLAFNIESSKHRYNYNNLKIDVIKNHLVNCLKDKKMQLALLPIYISAFIYFVGRYNDGMLMFYLKDIGAPSWLYLSTISIFNTAMFVIAPIFGRLIDKHYAKLVLILTISSLILFNIVFASLSLLPNFFIFIGLGLWGVQRAGATIIFAYLLFQKTNNKALYGTNLGILMFIIGIATLFGSIIAGYLSTIDFRYIFLFSSCCSVLAYISSRYIK